MNWVTSSRKHVVCSARDIKHRHTQRSSCQRSPQRLGTAQKPTAGETRMEKQRERQGDSLVHPGRGGLEPVDDLGVVYGEEDDADETDDEGDIVPWRGRRAVRPGGGKGRRGRDVQSHSLRIQYLHFIIACQSKMPSFASSLASLGVGLGVLFGALKSTPTRWPMSVKTRMRRRTCRHLRHPRSLNQYLHLHPRPHFQEAGLWVPTDSESAIATSHSSTSDVT